MIKANLSGCKLKFKPSGCWNIGITSVSLKDSYSVKTLKIDVLLET